MWSGQTVFSRLTWGFSEFGAPSGTLKWQWQVFTMTVRRPMSSSSSCVLIVRCPLVTTDTHCGRACCDVAAASPPVINAERRVISPLFTAWQVPQFVSLIDSFQDHPFLTTCVTPLVKQFVFFFFPAFQVSGERCSTEKGRKGHPTDRVHCWEKKKKHVPALTKEHRFLGKPERRTYST